MVRRDVAVVHILSQYAAAAKRSHGRDARVHWEIEKGYHWHRDPTLSEDACAPTIAGGTLIPAAMYKAILALLDRCYVTNVRPAMRRISAKPEQALALILGSPRHLRSPGAAKLCFDLSPGFGL